MLCLLLAFKFGLWLLIIIYFILFAYDIHLLSMWFLQHLYKSFDEECSFLQFATAITSNDLEEIQKFLEDSVDSRWFLLFSQIPDVLNIMLITALLVTWKANFYISPLLILLLILLQLIIIIIFVLLAVMFGVHT